VDAGQHELLMEGWAKLSPEQRHDAKAAAASGNYPAWLVDALDARGDTESWCVEDPSSEVPVMRRDIVEWLLERDD
jgi:hypothetical protein